eukprot:4623681-Pleurochrysis_carterae.AAC.2
MVILFRAAETVNGAGSTIWRSRKRSCNKGGNRVVVLSAVPGRFILVQEENRWFIPYPVSRYQAKIGTVACNIPSTRLSTKRPYVLHNHHACTRTDACAHAGASVHRREARKRMWARRGWHASRRREVEEELRAHVPARTHRALCTRALNLTPAALPSPQTRTRERAANFTCVQKGGSALTSGIQNICTESG